MSEDDDGRRELADVVEVYAAKREIDDAIAELAARPLDEAAATQMRAVLAGAGLVKARSTLYRLASATSRPRRRLGVVAPPGADPEPEEPERVMGVPA